MNAARGTVRGRDPAPGAGVVVRTGRARGLILHKKASSLGLYDSNTGQRRWVAPVGAKPHEMVLSQGNRYAYVTDYGVDTYTSPEEGGKTISIVDLNMGRRIGTIDLGTFRRPHGIVLGLSGRAYVTVDHPGRGDRGGHGHPAVSRRSICSIRSCRTWSPSAPTSDFCIQRTRDRAPCRSSTAAPAARSERSRSVGCRWGSRSIVKAAECSSRHAMPTSLPSSTVRTSGSCSGFPSPAAPRASGCHPTIASSL